MSLGQVKEIIRKPWGKAADDDGGAIEEKQKQPSAKWNQNACIPIRVPVQITIRNSSGTAEVYTAQTILLNQRGARLECTTACGEHPFKLHQVLWIEVPSTQKAAGGKVVWADSRPNGNGNFEFAVELGESRILLDAPFPPQDYERPETIQHTSPSFSAGIENPSEDLDAECYARLIPTRDVEVPAAQLHQASETIESDPGVSSPAVSSSDAISLTRTSPAISDVPSLAPEICKSAKELPPAEPVAAHHHTSPAEQAERAGHLLRTDEVQDESLPMTDRLGELFKLVIESAVQKEEVAASARLVNGIRDQVGQLQQAALENLRNEITQQVSVLEDQLLQQCRSRTEQMLSAIMKTALHALSNQVDEMAGRTEERIQEIFSSLVSQLEQRLEQCSAKALAETTSRLEEQMEQSAPRIHTAIVQKVLTEIGQKQKEIMEQVQQQIGMTTEQSLLKLRSGLIRALQDLTETNGKRAD